MNYNELSDERLYAEIGETLTELERISNEEIRQAYEKLKELCDDIMSGDPAID